SSALGDEFEGAAVNLLARETEGLGNLSGGVLDGGAGAEAGAEEFVRIGGRLVLWAASLHHQGDLAQNLARVERGEFRESAADELLMELGELAGHAGAAIAESLPEILQGLFQTAR